MTNVATDTATFNGLTVAAFESRREQEIATLISRFGGVPLVAPSMREAPLEDHSQALAMGEILIAGRLDAVIFMTGVGTKMLLEILEGKYSRKSIVEALSKTAVVARGSKTVRALAEAGVQIKIKVPEPNTWREVIKALDGPPRHDLAHARVAVQEYGESNDRLVAELRARGVGEVLSVPVYRWALPEDVRPLEGALAAIIEGRARIVVFTSAVQVDHVMRIAAPKGLDTELRAALKRCVVCSVGPTSSESLAAHGLAIDLEPESHKMGALIHEAARRAPALLRAKPANSDPPETGSTGGGSYSASARLARVTVEDAPEAGMAERSRWPRWMNSRFMKACRQEAVDATPVWLMRQAGRYMRSYRDLRLRVPFLSLCKSPDLVAEVTVTAASQIGADAAILFADLLLVAEPMGFSIEYEQRGGPWVTPRVETPAAINELVKTELAPDALAYVFEAVRRTRAALDSSTPLIGFAGAPFTLASYLIEGGPSKTYWHTKSLMWRDPGAWHELMAFLTAWLVVYANGQIEAGAQALQVFDSWVGCLSPEAYRQFVLPHMKRYFAAIKPGAPVIHFGTGTGALLELMREAGGSVLGLDFRVELDEAWKRLGYGVGVQGNLDPVVLGADLPTIHKQAVRILRQAAGRPGHIFNLGHGVLPRTPEDNVARLVEIVHEESARRNF